MSSAKAVAQVCRCRRLARSSERQHGQRRPAAQLGPAPRALLRARAQNGAPFGHIIDLALRCVGPGYELQQLGTEAFHLKGWPDAELPGEHVAAAAILRQRCADTILIHVQPHQRAMDGLLQRIQAEQPQRHLDGTIDRAADHVVVQQPAQNLVVGFLQPSPLHEQPRLEFLAAAIKAGQQLAAVKHGRPLQAFGRPIRGQSLEPDGVEVHRFRSCRDAARVDREAIARVHGHGREQA